MVHAHGSEESPSSSDSSEETDRWSAGGEDKKKSSDKTPEQKNGRKKAPKRKKKSNKSKTKTRTTTEEEAAGTPQKQKDNAKKPKRKKRSGDRARTKTTTTEEDVGKGKGKKPKKNAKGRKQKKNDLFRTATAEEPEVVKPEGEEKTMEVTKDEELDLKTPRIVGSTPQEPVELGERSKIWTAIWPVFSRPSLDSQRKANQQKPDAVQGEVEMLRKFAPRTITEKELHATDVARHSGSFSTKRARTPPPEKDKDSDASPHEGSDSGPKKDEGKQPQKEHTPLPKTAPTPVTEVGQTPRRQSCPPTPRTAITPEMEEKPTPKPQEGGDAVKEPGEKEEKKSPQDSLQKEKKGGTAMSLRKLKRLKDGSSNRPTSRTNTLVKSGSSSGTGSGPESRMTHRSGSKASRRPSHLSPVFFTRSLMFATICASLSSFQFGYSIGSINAPRDMIIKWINISYKSMFNEPIGEEHAEWIMSAIVSAFPLGAAIGGISSGVLADTAGRRGSLFYTNIIAFLAAGLMGTAKFVGVYHMMILGRFVIGIYVGITVIVPMYLVEISPRDIRGFVGSFHQLLITISILCSQIFGLPQIFGQEELWPYIFGFHAVPAFLQVYTLPMIPESPKFTLCIRGEVEQARADLEILRGTRNVDDEVEALRAETIAAMETFSDRLSMFDMFRDKYKWPTMVVVIMMFAQQTTGINAVMFYSSIIFKRILTNDEDAVYATVAVGVVNVLMTFPQMYLIDHPGCGRRPLLLSGAIGMIVSTALLTVSITLSYQGVPMGYQSAIVFVMLFVVSFATGPAAISWILASELFLTNARANGNAYMALTNWITSSIVGLTFPKLNEHLKQYSFLVFTFFNAAYFCFIWKYVPETSKRSIREINADLDRKSIRY